MDKNSIEFYKRNAKKYIEKTRNIDISHIIKKFIILLPSKSKILDIGSGSGRDLKIFKNVGFIPFGLDCIYELAEVAYEFSKIPIIIGNAQKLPIKDKSLDGIWACAVFLHLSKSEILISLKEIKRVIKSRGIIFISLKKGKGIIKEKETNRIFFLYEKEDIEKILKALNINIIEYFETYANNYTWINFLLQEEYKKGKQIRFSLKNLYYIGSFYLKKISESPFYETKIILKHILKIKDDVEFHKNQDNSIDFNKINLFFKILNKRLEGTPLNYLIGYKNFLKFKIKVSRAVLIPRPETEILVESVIKLFKNNNKKKLIGLDIGIGSGCISIGLLSEIKNLIMIGVDISLSALKVAYLNIKNYSLDKRILLVQSNLFDALKKKELFDFIVSNPPYVSNKDYSNLDKTIKDFEPSIALKGGKEGLYYIKKIINNSQYYLKKDGKLILEIGYNQYDKILKILPKFWEIYEVIKDYNRIERVLIIKRKGNYENIENI